MTWRLVPIILQTCVHKKDGRDDVINLENLFDLKGSQRL